MNISDIVAIIAIILAPIFAVQVQKWLENINESKRRKMNIFKALMATRNVPLYSAHVEALNMIDIEFYKNENVINAWRNHLNNFVNYPKDPKIENYDSKLKECGIKSNDLLIELLYEMSKVLKYNFDKELLQKGSYIPKGHGDTQIEYDIIRKGLVEVVSGKKTIPISIKDN